MEIPQPAEAPLAHPLVVMPAAVLLLYTLRVANVDLLCSTLQAPVYCHFRDGMFGMRYLISDSIQKAVLGRQEFPPAVGAFMGAGNSLLEFSHSFISQAAQRTQMPSAEDQGFLAIGQS